MVQRFRYWHLQQQVFRVFRIVARFRAYYFPNGFLKKIGVGFGLRDMTSEGRKESKQVASVEVAV